LGMVVVFKKQPLALGRWKKRTVEEEREKRRKRKEKFGGNGTREQWEKTTIGMSERGGGDTPLNSGSLKKTNKLLGRQESRNSKDQSERSHMEKEYQVGQAKDKIN